MFRFFILILLSVNVRAYQSGIVVPNNLLSKALAFFKDNDHLIANKDYIGIIDFKSHNSKERFYLYDLKNKTAESYLVAHGKNSDTDFDGYATDFSNTINSLQTSLGFYLTAEEYVGQNGQSLRLDGLSETNSNARQRAIVIHGADYVRPRSKIGRSFGCPAVELKYTDQVIQKLKEGALIFAAYE